MRAAASLALIAALALALVLAACKRSAEPASGSGSASAAGTASTASSAKPGANRSAKLCTDLQRQAEHLLASGGHCTRDEDCVCVGRNVLGCGGATDARTARRLSTLRKLHGLSGCASSSPRCGQPRCGSARCRAKRCVSAASG
ncbi:MAG: hypothetical protein KC503_03395 [Myxococcales bacterium]|nr:hypothetical protein [Myxococcales bacterium]